MFVVIETDLLKSSIGRGLLVVEEEVEEEDTLSDHKEVVAADKEDKVNVNIFSYICSLIFYCSLIDILALNQNLTHFMNHSVFSSFSSF